MQAINDLTDQTTERRGDEFFMDYSCIVWDAAIDRSLTDVFVPGNSQYLEASTFDRLVIASQHHLER